MTEPWPAAVVDIARLELDLARANARIVELEEENAVLRQTLRDGIERKCNDLRAENERLREAAEITEINRKVAKARREREWLFDV